MKGMMAGVCVCMMFLTACTAGNTQNTEQGTAKKHMEQEESYGFTEDTMPRIDGSTATIPLSEGLAMSLLGMTEEQAAGYIEHNTTHAAYANLFDGNCDIIFVTPPSEAETELAEDKNFEFEVIPVVNDAFVFLNNDKNRVNDLSLEQVQDIYRGKITNWQELGGKDLPITAYQRPDNSGSQTLFYKLILPKEEAAQAPSVLYIDTMMGLIQQVSNYDSGEGSIGYSVYYYAKEMYPSDHSKIISIDGVMPTEDTIASGKYPLNSPYYAVIRKDSPKDSPERKLISYILSHEGQKVAVQSGYVPIEPLK